MKIVMIVGSNGLIGKEVVKKYLDEKKFKVFLIDKENELEKKNGLIFKKINLENLKTLEHTFQKILRDVKLPDIFINCSYPRTNDWIKNNLSQINFKSYRKNIDIHLNTYLWLSKMTLDLMKKKKIKGSVILLSSMYGHVGQNLKMYKNTNMRENITYAVIKGGIINAVRSMASYYGRYKIRINSVSPGALAGHVAGKSDKQSKNFIKNFLSLNPMQRLGNPQEIAEYIYFLSTKDSEYITGTDTLIDGGYTII